MIGAVDVVDVAVGELLGSDGTQCTATLIGPMTALTAGHCVEASELVFVLDGEYAVTAVQRPDTYDAALLGSDLALLTLERPSAVTPVALAHAPVTAGAGVMLVGFGGTAERRAAATVVAELGGPRFVTAGGACAGDSGGAVLVATASGNALAGVISSGDAGCQGTSTHVRLGAFMPWLTGSADTAPRVTITSPASGDAVPDVLGIDVALADDHGALAWTVAIDGERQARHPVTGDTLTIPLAVRPGEHVIEIVAVDASGLEGRASIDVLVEAPTGELPDEAGCSATGARSSVLPLFALLLVCRRRRS